MDTFVLLTAGALLIVALVWVRRIYFDFDGQSPEDYVDAGATFDLQRHLRGPMICEGLIYGPTGRVTSRFVGHFDITWEGTRGIMSERFEYDSGEIQTRQWVLEVQGSGKVKALADDVVGTGSGVQRGSAFQLLYKLRLPEASGGHVLHANDWMYLTPSGTILNRSQFRKFGIKVAELVATMRPVSQEERMAA
ncbi:DUF3833 family protein [Pseudaestuariivita sp.]|uniref:DUF3833 family protein n=1 Tax=Pseudaestuariivita sp. TaxID=2211669 RepID=UPI00405941C4